MRVYQEVFRIREARRLWLAMLPVRLGYAMTGIAIVFLGTIPILNLIVPVLGTAAMVHVAQTLKPPDAPGLPFRPPA